VEKLRIGEAAANAYIGTQLAAVTRGCDWLDRAAPDPGGDPDMLDIAASCAVEWIGFRHPELDIRSGRPRLAAWVDAMVARPSMQATGPE
jgi:glutathione S-transferase